MKTINVSIFGFSSFTLHSALCILQLIPLAFVVGCSQEVRNFSVAAKNDTKFDLTLNLAKDDQQNEEMWASPEDIDEDRVMFMPDTPLGIVVVPPGKTATKGDISGHFSKNEQAILRIYRGKDFPLRLWLAIQPGADRQDVVLKPGENKFVVHDIDGKLSVDRLP